MGKIFNVTADCKPGLHYMVDISSRLARMKGYVDRGEYFTINRARQYGKTTTLRALKEYLKDQYYVFSMDFQVQMSYAKFRSENAFSAAFAKAFVRIIQDPDIALPEAMKTAVGNLKRATRENREDLELVELFQYLSDICRTADKPLVLMIDEIDSAANNRVFLDFLAQLRGHYIDRDKSPAFQSVILAGVYDIKNLKRKFRPGEDDKLNSPWNIAVDFKVGMSFTAGEIAEEVAGGEKFPELKAAWTYAGFMEAYQILLGEKNTLFESMVNKLYDYTELRDMVCSILFTGKEYSYNALDQAIGTAEMFGFIKNVNGTVAIANRIFEMVFYNLFLTSAENQNTDIYKAAIADKNQFIYAGHLNSETC